MRIKGEKWGGVGLRDPTLPLKPSALDLLPLGRLLKVPTVCGPLTGVGSSRSFPLSGGSHGEGPFYSFGNVGNLGEIVFGGFIQ